MGSRDDTTQQNIVYRSFENIIFTNLLNFRMHYLIPTLKRLNCKLQFLSLTKQKTLISEYIFSVASYAIKLKSRQCNRLAIKYGAKGSLEFNW